MRFSKMGYFTDLFFRIVDRSEELHAVAHRDHHFTASSSFHECTWRGLFALLESLLPGIAEHEKQDSEKHENNFGSHNGTSRKHDVKNVLIFAQTLSKNKLTATLPRISSIIAAMECLR